MSADAKRFVELVIATTIGSIVGAYIARDIQFSVRLFVRALFVTALLAVFFFFVWQFSTHIGKHRKASGRNEKHYRAQEEREEETYDEETEPYEEYDSEQEALDEEQAHSREEELQ